MSFVNVFGGNTIYSAEVDYREVALSVNVTLAWPTETNGSSDVLASIMDVTPSGAGFTIRLPAANLASVGETALFFNLGADPFIVADNGGNTIVTIAAGLAWQVYLTDNADADGSWRAIEYGAGTSSATAGSLVGLGIKAIGATLNQSTVMTTIAVDYSVGETDRSKALNWTGGAGTFTMPSTATVGNDWFVHVRNSGTGVLTLQTGIAGQDINGGATLTMNPGDSATLVCDGGDYFTIGLGKAAIFAFDFVSIDLTGQPSPLVLSGANLNRIAYRFTGTITNDVQIVVPSTIQQYWIANATDVASSPYTVTVKTLSGLGVSLERNERAIAYCDGVDVLSADTSDISLPVAITQGGTGAITASGARTNLGSTAVGDALFTAVSASTGRATLGATAVGDALFITSSASAARTTLGATAVGDAVFIAIDAAAARTAIGAGTGSGSVLSVDVSGGTTGLTFTGGPVTTTGTITMAGTLEVDNGGTGLSATPTNGQLLIGNGTGYTLATLTAGSGISITNGAGTVTIAAGGLSSLGMFSASAAAATPVALQNLYYAGLQPVYPSSSSVNGPSIVWCQSLGVFACTAGSSRVLTSPDGVTWTVRTNTIAANRIAFDGTNLVTNTGTSVSRSTDGVNFSNVTALPTIGNDSAGIAGTILWVANAATGYTSTNGGTSYTTQTLPVSAEQQPNTKEVYAVGTRFVIKSGNTLYHSTTGATGSWTTLAIADALAASVIVSQGPDGCLYIATGSNATGRLLRFIRLNTDMTFTTIANLVGQTFSINSTTRASAVRLGSAMLVSANGQTSINGASGRYTVGDLPSFSDTGTSQERGFFSVYTQWAQSSTRIVSTSDTGSGSASNYPISYPIDGPTGLYQV